MVALSPSRVIRVSPSATSSPTATLISIISTASPVPRSGSLTVCSADWLLAAGLSDFLPSDSFAGGFSASGSASGFFSAADDSAFSGAAESEDSISTIAVPWEILSPTFTNTFLTTPALGDGTSMEALSDSSTSRVSSTLISSPMLTLTSITSTSSAPPRSGTLMVSLAIDTAPYTKSGLDFSGSMPKSAMACLTTARSILPCLASP